MSGAREVSAGRFERKPMAVEAIQWVGEENCQEVHDWLGWEHSPDETDHSVVYISVYPNGVMEREGDEAVLNQTVEVVWGSWFTRDEKGDVRVYAEGQFEDEFERVTEG